MQDTIQSTPPAVHYISNKEFTQAIADYKLLCESMEAEGKEAPPIPNKIAKQIMILASKLGSRYNFAGYTFRDEMVSSAIYACCAKIRKFDMAISQNAFAYFTNVCWRAMVDVINYEEKMSYIKAKSFQSVEYDDTLADNDLSEFSDYTGSINDYVPYFDVDEYEKKIDAQRTKSRTPAAKKVIPGSPLLDTE
jgi:hypothetical protein